MAESIDHSGLRDSRSLFPLPLTPFEHYMWTDDRPAYPMTGVLEYHFRGSIDRDAWEAAVAESLTRHPLLTAHVVLRGLGRPCWVIPSREPTPVDWGPWSARIRLPKGEGIDLTRENGLRVFVRQGEDRVRVLTQVHHACTDALGAMRFFGDVLAGYARRVEPDGPHPIVDPLDAACLARRGVSRWGEPPEPVSFWRAVRRRVRETVLWFSRRPAPIAVPMASLSARADEPTEYPSIQYHTFSPAATARLRQLALQAGGPLNDLLLRDLFVTLAEWDRRQVRRPSGKWLVVAVPTSLRRPEDVSMPAANVMSYAFVTRRRDACQDPAALLERIQRDTRAVKRWNLGMIFLEGLAAVQRIPGFLRLSVLGSRCLATTVLSNLSDPIRSFGVQFREADGAVVVGGLRLERLIAAPPLRPQTRAVFCISSHAQRLTLSVRGDPRSFTLAKTKQLLRAYVQTVCRQAGLAEEEASCNRPDGSPEQCAG
jgi:hypothetical protein